MAIEDRDARAESRQTAKELADFKLKMEADLAEIRRNQDEQKAARETTDLRIDKIQSTLDQLVAAIHGKAKEQVVSEPEVQIVTGSVPETGARVQDRIQKPPNPASSTYGNQTWPVEGIIIQEAQHRPMEPQIRYLDNHFLHEMPAAGDGFGSNNGVGLTGNDDLETVKPSQLSSEYGLEDSEMEVQDNMKVHAVVLHPSANDAEVYKQVDLDVDEGYHLENTEMKSNEIDVPIKGLELIEVRKVCSEVYKRWTLNCGVSMIGIDMKNNQCEQVGGVSVHFRYKELVVGCISIVQGVIQWDYKRYKKKLYARSGVICSSLEICFKGMKY